MTSLLQWVPRRCQYVHMGVLNVDVYKIQDDFIQSEH